ncbi:MAG: leucine-rich repeat protein [Ruminococcus sp.]|nr:leucine-rich repeat protein [Ruminococcus sp.]
MKVTSRKTIAMLSAGILTLSCIPAEMFPVSATSAVTENTLQLGAPVTIDNNLVCEVLEQKEDETFLLKITDVKDTTITSLTFPEEYDGYPIQFVELGDSVFKNCTNLTEITLPDEISAIPQQAFYGCTSLTTVNASNVTEIESDAFCNCTSLTTLNVSENVVKMGADALYHTAIFNEQYDEDGNEAVIKYFNNWVIGLKSNLSENEKDIVIQEGTVGIANSSILRITSVQLPSTLKYIGDRAFQNQYPYNNLSEINLPEGLISIGSYAFESTNLKEITIPSSVESVGSYAFSKTKIETVVVESGVKEINDYAFNSCSSLKTVTIGDNIQKMGTHVFSNDTALTDVTIGDGTEEIGERAFEGDRALLNVTIGEGLKDLQCRTFANCTFLKKIDLPDSLTSISSDAFSDSALMENGLSPLKYADNWLIGYNSNNTDDSEVTVKKGTVGIASNALYKHQMETLNLPDSLKYINSGAISYTGNLKTVTLPQGLERIETYAFISSGFSEITIPESVEYIGKYALWDCNLEKITILNPNCKIYNDEYTLNGKFNVFTIYGFNVSTAHDYANKYNLNFVALDAVETTTTTEATTTTTTTITTTTTAPVTTTAPTTTTTEAELMQGDVDGDDVISVSDAVDVLKIYAMSAAGMDVSDFTAAQFQAADVDGDGVVAVSDAVYLLTYYARKAAGIDVTWDDIVNK